MKLKLGIQIFVSTLACTLTDLFFRAGDIVDLKLIEKQNSTPPERSTVTIAKPIAKRAGRTQSTSETTNSSKANSKHVDQNNGNKYQNNAQNGNQHRSKPIDIEPRHNHTGDGASLKNNTPNKREKNKGTS